MTISATAEPPRNDECANPSRRLAGHVAAIGHHPLALIVAHGPSAPDALDMLQDGDAAGFRT